MSNRLPILQNELRAACEGMQRHINRAAEHALAAGEILTEAKALCDHGSWSRWLAEAGVPERSAQRYMLLHRAGFKSAIVAEIGSARAERYATDGERLRPDPGMAICAVSDDARPPESGRLSYWWQEGDGDFNYWHFDLAEGTQTHPGHPVPLWVLAIYRELVSEPGSYCQRPVPASEAMAFVAHFAGARP